jgi:adenosine deaminase
MLKQKFLNLMVVFMTMTVSAFCGTENVQQIPSIFCEMPKAELHLHLGGAFPLDFLLEIATPSQQQKLTENLNLISKGVSYNDIFQVFKIVSQIVNSDEKIEAGTYALCQSLENDGVVYAEIRTGLKDFGNGFEGYLQSVLNGLKKGCSDKFQGKLLLSLQRSSTLDVAKKTVDLALKYKDSGIIGLDISGDSTTGDIETINSELLRAKSNGLFLTVHMGEAPNEKNQIEILQSLKPDRIGHGVFLSQDALNWILENKVPLEVCLTSSVLVQMTNDYVEHPGLQYYKEGHPIVICTDDPLIFRTSLSNELQILYNVSSFNLDEVKDIARASFKYAFSQ